MCAQPFVTEDGKADFKRDARRVMDNQRLTYVNTPGDQNNMTWFEILRLGVMLTKLFREVLEAQNSTCGNVYVSRQVASGQGGALAP